MKRTTRILVTALMLALAPAAIAENGPTLASNFTNLAGGTSNAQNLVNALRNGTSATLTTTTTPAGSTTPVTTTTTIDVPTKPMGWGNVKIALALAQNPFGELPVAHAVDVDRSFGEGQEHGLGLHPDCPRKEADEWPHLHQPRLVHQERDQPERADQPLGLLAELAAAVEHCGALERLGAEEGVKVAAGKRAVAETMEGARAVGVFVEDIAGVGQAKRGVDLDGVEPVAECLDDRAVVEAVVGRGYDHRHRVGIFRGDRRGASADAVLGSGVSDRQAITEAIQDLPGLVHRVLFYRDDHVTHTAAVDHALDYPAKHRRARQVDERLVRDAAGPRQGIPRAAARRGEHQRGIAGVRHRAPLVGP